MLLEAGADPNIVDKHFPKYELSPLALACEHKKPTIVNMLLKAGAQPDRYALKAACYYHNVEMVKFFIQSGAVINEELKHKLFCLEGKSLTPLEQVILCSKFNGRCKQFDADFQIAKLLLEKGAMIDADSHPNEVWWALYDSNIEMLELLLNHGVALNYIFEKFLECIEKRYKEEREEFLKESRHEFFTLVKFLLDRGCDLTPASVLAKENGDEALVQFIEESNQVKVDNN